MASKYWLKLYYEILDDPKMGKLRPSTKWRFIECLLVAGERDEGGFLPGLDELAWRIRADREQLEKDMLDLAEADILKMVDGRWLVVKFAERQAPVSDAERMRRYRERQQKQEYYDLDTKVLPNGYDTVTNRNADTDTDKIRIDEDEDYMPQSGKNNHRQQIDPLLKPAIGQLVDDWLRLVGGSKPANTDMCRSKLYEPAKQLLEHLDGDYPKAMELLKQKRTELLAQSKTPKWLEAVVYLIVADLHEPESKHFWED